jgi:hypothetical protein
VGFVAVAAGHAGLVHAALAVGAVFEDFVLLLAVGKVELGAQGVGQVVVEEGAPGAASSTSRVRRAWQLAHWSTCSWAVPSRRLGVGSGWPVPRVALAAWASPGPWQAWQPTWSVAQRVR